MYVWAMRDKGSEWRTVNSLATIGQLPFVPLVEAACEPYHPRVGNPVGNPVAEMEKLGVRNAFDAILG